MTPDHSLPAADLYAGDAAAVLAALPAGSARVCVTSPPYYALRSYLPAGHPDRPLEVGREATPAAYAARLAEVFRAVRRVLSADGCLWLNLGDGYAGYHGNSRHAVPTSTTNGWTRGYNENDRPDRRPQDIGLKEKDLIGAPWLVAAALRADGWYLRADVVWYKTAAAREPRARDRPERAHEYLFLLTPEKRYKYDKGVMEAAGRRGSVWAVPARPARTGHPAGYPAALIDPCVRACSDAGDTVLDPFCGSGTTGEVAVRNGRRFVGIDLCVAYLGGARDRLAAAGDPIASR